MGETYSIEERPDWADPVADASSEPSEEAMLEAAPPVPDGMVVMVVSAPVAVGVAVSRADDSIPRAPVETAVAEAPLAEAAAAGSLSVRIRG